MDVLVKDAWAPVWENHPAVREVLAWPARDAGARGVITWSRRLRARGYAGCWDLQGSPRTRALCLLAGLPVLGRPNRAGRARRRLVRSHTGGPPPDFHMATAFRRTVDPDSGAAPGVIPGREARDRAASRVPGERRLVGLAPGARHATKQWPLEFYAAVAGELVRRDLGPVPVFFGPGEEALEARWRELAGAGDWTGLREDLSTVAGCLARLRALVTNDTGLMHLAAAVGTPVVAMFGPTVRNFGFTPVGEGHHVLETELSCRPCTLHGGPACPLGHHRCLRDVSPDQVLRALRLGDH